MGIKKILLFGVSGLLLLIFVVTSIRPTNAVGSLGYTLIATHPGASAQSTSTGKTIHNLTVFNNKLYAGYGDYNINTGPISINPFNLNTRTFDGSQLSLSTEEITRFRAINGKLYAPMIDPRCAGVCAAGYGAGEPWVQSTPITGEHIFDMASLNGSDLWMVGSTSPTGATAWRSTDGGTNWQVVQSDVGSPVGGYERYYWIAQINGSVYMQAADTSYAAPVRSFNGTSWSSGMTTQLSPYNAPVVTYKNQIITTKDGLSAFDGTTVTSKLGVSVRNMTVDGDYLYVLQGDNMIVRTNDLINWQKLGLAPSDSTAIAVTNNKIYFGTSNSQIYESNTTIPDVPSLMLSGIGTGEKAGKVVQLSADIIGTGSVLARAEFRLNGDLLATDISDPFDYVWDTTLVKKGTYELTVTGEDNLGNSLTSNSITVIVTTETAVTQSSSSVAEPPAIAEARARSELPPSARAAQSNQQNSDNSLVSEQTGNEDTKKANEADSDKDSKTSSALFIWLSIAGVILVAFILVPKFLI